ncbi:hypothetical protein [Streptomyces sp.]|uniref:hypothetical protein n=1 Tax=Streptomyces sp. TaxID=1931 RepID=UPI002F9393B1
MTERTDLTLEVRGQENRTAEIGPLMITPSLGEDYWAYRVMLSDKQAIVGFPKFMTIGIGFAVEDEDWNTNLPFTCDAVEIYEHIAENKGDDAISREDCIAAIRMIQEAAHKDREDGEAEANTPEQRVHQTFADADIEGVDLNAMTVAELTALVMGAINGGEPGE